MSKSKVEIKCIRCGKSHLVPKNDWDYAENLRKKDPSCKRRLYCSKECSTLDSRTRITFNCLQCGKEGHRVPAENKKNNGNNFCSHTCSATYSNANRVLTTKGKTKHFDCNKCGVRVTLSIHTIKANRICTSCNPARNDNMYVAPGQRIVEKECNRCKKTCSMRTCRKYCEKCYPIIRSECGKKGGTQSVLIQGRRSKNEAAFANAIQKLLPNSKMLCNQGCFEDERGYKWDADIVLPELKLAIHWNGAWHYQEIYSRRPLKITQNRDKFKHKLIESYGFTNYIVKDMGKHNMEKVKLELELFIKFLSDQFSITINV